MRLTEFTEFSYGFSLTDSLVHAYGKGVKGAPQFPSLIKEGQKGGGYDVKIPVHPQPVFLQFKIPQLISRHSKLLPPDFDLLSMPYYRMHLRTKYPNQHQLLLDLQATEPLVFYAAPRFDTVSELDKFYVSQTTHSQSIFFRPSAIGALDSKPHHVAYHASIVEGWRFSEPSKVNESFDGESLFGFLAATVSQRSRRSASKALFGLRTWLIDRTENFRNQMRYRTSKGSVGDVFNVLQNSADSPLNEQARIIAYAFQVRLGLTLGFIDADIVGGN